MEINWFEIVAQIINFGIVLFILQKLLYKPVMKVMKDREDGIALALNHADQKMNEAQELIERYEQKIEESQAEEEKILNAARKEASRVKETLIESYKEEAEEKRIAFQNDLKQEKEQFIDALGKSLGKNAVKLAGHILTSMSEQDIKKLVFDEFIKKIKDLKLDSSDDSIKMTEDKPQYDFLILTSAEEVLEDDKKRLKRVIDEKIANDVNINYKVDESLVIGYELKFETFTLSSNIKKYLEEAEKNVLKILNEQLE